MAELIAPYPIVVTTMVAWGDMDANRHVNNVIYFRYIEHARLQYFDELGFSDMQQETGIGPILAWTDCRFRRPLSYPDTVSIGTRIRDVESDRFVMDAIIVSHAQKQRGGRRASSTLVVYDYHNHHKAPLPDVIRQRIDEFESAGPILTSINSFIITTSTYSERNTIMSASISLKGKVALVTGGGRGIGKAITKKFAEAGASVVIASRKMENLKATADEFAGLPGKVVPIECHVGRDDQLEAWWRRSRSSSARSTSWSTTAPRTSARGRRWKSPTKCSTR